MGIDSALPPQRSLLFLKNLQEFCRLKTLSSLTKFVDIGQQIEKLWGKADRLYNGRSFVVVRSQAYNQIIKEKNQLFLQDVWLGQESGGPDHAANEGEGRHPAPAQSSRVGSYIPTEALYCPLSLLAGKAL